MKQTILFTLATLVVILQIGCATATTGARSADLQRSYTVEKGTVVSVTEVTIDNTKGNHSGAITGAGSGALSGAFIDESIEGAIAGAIVGGLMGSTIENLTGKQKGYELDIRKTDGTIVRILQRKQTLEGISVNEEIELMTDSDGTTIVKRLK
ncbi:MAG: hypothetical protein AAF065_14605 [Verrucomicrobiota bacterium]